MPYNCRIFWCFYYIFPHPHFATVKPHSLFGLYFLVRRNINSFWKRQKTKTTYKNQSLLESLSDFDPSFWRFKSADLLADIFFLPLRALAWRKLDWRLMAPSVGGFDRSWNQAIIFGQTFGSGINNKDVSIGADLTAMQNGRSNSSRLANSSGESSDTFWRSSCWFPLENISLAALL